MEIQFTIKLVGSTGGAAVVKKDTDDKPAIRHSLGSHPGVGAPKPSRSGRADDPLGEGKGDPLGPGGGDPLGPGGGDPLGPGGGDPLGPGGGGTGMGQIIVIGPIVVSAGGAMCVADTKGLNKKTKDDEEG